VSVYRSRWLACVWRDVDCRFVLDGALSSHHTACPEGDEYRLAAVEVARPCAELVYGFRQFVVRAMGLAIVGISRPAQQVTAESLSYVGRPGARGRTWALLREGGRARCMNVGVIS